MSAPASPQVTQFPENRPYAAVDGDPGTAWLADRFLTPDRHVLTLRLRRPRDVPELLVTPYDDPRAEVLSVVVNGRGFRLRHGVNRLRVGLRGVREVRIALGIVRGSRTRSAGAGGLREVSIPGLRVREALRPPVVAERALAGADLARTPLTYLFSRVTADAPFVQGRQTGQRGAGLLRDAQDPERRLVRRIAPPAARTWALDAWGRPDPRTPDSAFDRLAGTRGALRAESSSRFAGLPRYRASGAFDGTAARGWVGQWIPGRAAWLAWTTPGPTTLRELTLAPAAVRVRRPTRVALTVDGRREAPLAVGADGRVVLPAPVRGRTFRLDVLRAAFPPGTPPRLRQRRAVGVGELRAAGLPRLEVPRSGRVALPCGSAAVRVGSTRVGLRGSVDRAALDAGGAVRLEGCRDATLPAGRVDVVGERAPLSVDHLRLDAAAPEADAIAVALPTGTATPGVPGNGERRDASVTATGPAWVVLGETHSTGWRATCDGRDLGPSRPMQGYANAWPVAAPGCRDLDFAWAPNRVLRPAYLLSLLGALALLAFLVLDARRRRAVAPSGARPPSTRQGAPAPLPAAGPPARVALPRALAIGAAASLVLGFVFALRAGVVLGPLVALVLWRGVGPKALTLGAGVLLLGVVPLLYVLFPGDDRGGYSTTYATDHLGAHWVAVGAVSLLGLALWRTLSTARGRRDGPGPGPSPAARPG